MSTPAPTPESGAIPAASYAAATQTLRTTVRWLLTAAAGVGGVLVAGLQLTSIGSLDQSEWPRLLAAVAGVAAALAGIGYMISRASRILVDDWITLAQLSLEDFQEKLRAAETTRELLGELEAYKNELYAHVAEDITDLYARLIEANTAARGEGDPNAEPVRKSADFREAASSVVQYANYFTTRENFKVLRGQLGRAAAVVAVGVLVFAYAANPPEPAPPTTPAGTEQPPTSLLPEVRPPAPSDGPATRSPSPSR